MKVVMGMDELTRAYYELKFKVEFMERKGNAFQDFFSEIMEKCFPGQFQRVRPWGRHGDKKNDGCIINTGQFFQVYAPNEMKAAAAIRKIDEDFRGALRSWGEYLREWVFVHNSREGLSPGTLKKLIELQEEHPKVRIREYGFEELRQKLFSLSDEDIAAILGPAPTKKDMVSFGFDDLKPILLGIADSQEATDPDLRPVPTTKLLANGLSSSVQTLIKAGMGRAHKVQEFLDVWHDPMLGEKIATAFHAEYKRLKDEIKDPDEIFYKLQIFAGGSTISEPRLQTAILAVLAFLFEKCDIFERPREEYFL